MLYFPQQMSNPHSSQISPPVSAKHFGPLPIFSSLRLQPSRTCRDGSSFRPQDILLHAIPLPAPNMKLGKRIRVLPFTHSTWRECLAPFKLAEPYRYRWWRENGAGNEPVSPKSSHPLPQKCWIHSESRPGAASTAMPQKCCMHSETRP